MNATTTTSTWQADNQRYLSMALNAVRTILDHHLTSMREGEHGRDSSVVQSLAAIDLDALHDAALKMSAPPALETLCALFSLSPFERDILLLCAGCELSSSFATLCAALQGEGAHTSPTFGQALATLSEPHWNALTPNAPLRRWRLIEVGMGNVLTASPLRIDERVLHYLSGVQYMDERLLGIIEALRVTGDLVPSHRLLVEQIVSIWSQAAKTSPLPIIQLCGDEIAGKRLVAAKACSELGLHVSITSAYAIPTNPGELESLIRLWEREAALSTSALLVDCDEMERNDAGRDRTVARLIESTNGALIITSRERRHTLRRPMITFDVSKPSAAEQQSAWQSALGQAASSLNGRVELLVSQFNLSASAIFSASTEALGRFATTNSTKDAGSLDSQDTADELGKVLWDVCRVQARSRLDDLAQRIEPASEWDDLVLPELQRQILRDISAHVRQRARVYETWGFSSKGARGLGISALFAGASGTGKTMAAEVLANELRLDLYRIDLSQIVSKYIGETEKNLRRVFDAAEEGGSILLFDEADALFGKRSEVRDSHDRYANVEISYLLQRMEAYRGLAILTTNMKNALDSAFQRRIRFVVQFPFPDAGQRAEIWRRIFPAATPIESLDYKQLSRLQVAGGSIRNIAMNGAFVAAEASEPVRMFHLLQAARGEYAKLERPLTESEIGGW